MSQGRKSGDGSTMHEYGHNIVLVVDDEPAHRALTLMHLQRGGLEVVSAGTRPEALDHVQETRIAACVLDVKMGDNDRAGIELMLDIRSKVPDMPIIFLTGYDPSLTIDYPQIDVIQKPLEGPVYREMVLKLQALIRNRCRDQHIAKTREDMGETLRIVRKLDESISHPENGLIATKAKADAALKRDLGDLIVDAGKKPLVWGLLMLCSGLLGILIKVTGGGVLLK